MFYLVPEVGIGALRGVYPEHSEGLRVGHSSAKQMLLYVASSGLTSIPLVINFGAGGGN